MSDLDLDGLRDLNPPEPDDHEYEAVRARARRLRQRSWSLRGGVAVLLAIAVAATAVVAGAHNTGESIRTIRSAKNTTPTTALPASVQSLCFPNSNPSLIRPGGVRDLAVRGWPSNLPPLLVLEGDGNLWVIGGGHVRAWTTGSDVGAAATGYLSARFAPDGTIYATRVVHDKVDLQHLDRPQHVAANIALPFTVKRDAPKGSCPIDGYLATFSIGPEGLVLVRHQAGPVPHSCPPLPKTTATTSEWRCQSPDEISFEVRTLPFKDSGTALGIGMGGYGAVVSDSTHATAFAVVASGTVTVVRPGATPECCEGGQNGDAFALSPDGSRLAYTPDGTHVEVAGLQRAEDTGRELWTAPDRIDGLAWTGTWIAVAHGGVLTLVSTVDGSTHDLAGFEPGTVLSLDWAR